MSNIILPRNPLFTHGLAKRTPRNGHRIRRKSRQRFHAAQCRSKPAINLWSKYIEGFTITTDTARHVMIRASARQYRINHASRRNGIHGTYFDACRGQHAESDIKTHNIWRLRLIPSEANIQSDGASRRRLLYHRLSANALSLAATSRTRAGVVWRKLIGIKGTIAAI